MVAARKILHVDMDAFYASVEQRDDPSLCGKPLVVDGGSNRGVVAAASYESREFGIRSAMPMREAMRRCPELISVSPRMSHYKAVSEQIFEIFNEFTPLVEGLSLDEAFLDVSDSLTIFGTEIRIAQRIKQRIREVTKLTASVGVAPNKLVAKIASDLKKPDGLVVVTDDNMETTLDPLPVEVIPGIGRETLARLRVKKIVTIADLRLAPDQALEAIFGRFAGRTRERASGIDHRPVVASQAALCHQHLALLHQLRLWPRAAGQSRGSLAALSLQLSRRHRPSCQHTAAPDRRVFDCAAIPDAQRGCAHADGLGPDALDRPGNRRLPDPVVWTGRKFLCAGWSLCPRHPDHRQAQSSAWENGRAESQIARQFP